MFSNSTIVTVVGNGSNAGGSDGLPGTYACVNTQVLRCTVPLYPRSSIFVATLTAINLPVGVSAYDPSGSFYVSDTLNRVVRRVYPNGSAFIVAGSLGVSGATGNRVPGKAALFTFPRSLTISGSDVVISDSGVHAVRVLYANQTVATLMGVLGSSGVSGDGGLGECALLAGVMHLSS